MVENLWLCLVGSNTCVKHMVTICPFLVSNAKKVIPMMPGQLFRGIKLTRKDLD